MQSYQSSLEALYKTMGVNPNAGLSHEAIEKKQREFGFNEIEDTSHKSIPFIFLSQFQNALIYVLLIAATLIFFTSDKTIDAFIVTGILFFNAILGTVQEYRAQNIIESLKQFIRTDTLVLREGTKIIVRERDLVPGDIMFLHEGERIPADARIIECSKLGVDESVLTGESSPVYKNITVITEPVPVYQQNNMLFKGTTILSGNATAIVTCTGINTEFGKLQKSVSEIDTETTLKKSLDELSIIILISIVILCFLLFLVGLWIGKPTHELVSILIALFICIIPEGLPLVLTLVLVSGARQLAKNKILVRNMQAVESLGHIDAIVIDKTGTITKNELMIAQIFADQTEYTVTGSGYRTTGEFFIKDTKVQTIDKNSDLYKTGIITELMSDAQVIPGARKDTFTIRGNPTEAALLVCAEKMNIPKEVLAEYRQISETPFRPETQLHTALYGVDNRKEAYIIGSPEAVFKHCSSVSSFFEASLQTLLDSGFRVIAVASKIVPRDQESEDIPNDGFQLIALLGIQDTIRENIVDIVKQARNAGIQIIMATGDHEITAKIVAQTVGILDKEDENIDGSVFASMSDEAVENSIERTTLFSRMLPEYKMRIIRALRKKNKVIAMTGDGINDAPALAFADVGIAMGSGTEVAKEASDIVLLDDSFAYIIKAITFGRHIFYTLKRVILYFFATNLSELCIILLVLLLEALFHLKLPLPITAAQILWLNLVTDGFLDIGISMEQEEPNLLEIPKKTTRLLDWTILGIGLYCAIFMGVISLCMFYVHHHENIKMAQTITLITMAMFQWFNAWNCRSIEKSLFSLGLFSNKPLLLITLFVFVLQLGVVYLPTMQYLFDTTYILFYHWIIITLIASSIIVCEEIRKYVQRRKIIPS